ncbi:branched-chain amino acid transport system substrate-binding protein [Natronocella acetinitrilica]|uniref:Branched-chain amino acid transport system substrate-binding protein n=1 Tax=Natronocella acetinitrilica TaxID=414046 RepID=A0AAE3G960_9GAMM|nr:transporter substrate-binding domain-containing protein [Natronocella acetinitrilica]MCP1676768.1 branched-chain amino acid transport system substrate-binding protein [Natronocella acetinitrilica]
MGRNSSSENAWRVGVLFSQTGVTAVIEKSQLNGALLAIEEINEGGGVHGREIEPVIYDPGSVVARYGELAEHLLTEDDVNVIFGCYMSSSRKEVLPVIERRNALFFYPTLYEGFEYSANVIYGGAAPNQNSVPLASYLMENFGSRFYFVGSDYIYPRESNRVMRNVVRQGGGEVVGERYVTLEAGPHDFDKILEDVRAQAPDVIFSTVVGTGTINLYRAYLRTGGDGKRVPIASLTTNEAEVAEMGPEAAAGHITAAPYFRNIQSEANRRFLERYQRRFGTLDDVTSCCEAAYFQAHMFANALRATGSMDTDRLRSALQGADFDAPQGRVKIDPDNNHTYLQSRIGRVDDLGEYVVEMEVGRAIKPDPYLVTPALNDWSIRLMPPREGLITL